MRRKKREENFTKFEKYFKYSCTIMESKIKILKNILNQISKEHLNIKISPKLKRLLETEEEKGENIFEMDFITKKKL